ncbi:MAG: choice-of-anchor D domain-containing protein [Prevotella sp.]|nr:choice-of-anchor D domain-containing protein [Prevotella sp.]
MRKVKLFLLMLVALLAGATPSWADTWTVAGSSSQVLGSAWDPEETSNDMTQVDGTTLWYLTKQSVALTAGDAGDIYFKVCKDHSWETAYPNDNHTLTVDADGTYDVTFWYNSADNAVYATYVYSIMGNLWDNWATDKDMVQDSENPFVYTLTIDEFAAEANKTYEYKLHANHAWADYQIPSGSGNNNSWTPTEAGNYTLVFTANVTTHTLELTATKIEEPAAGYICDFNTAISTSDHAFQVASNWRHIVDTYEDYWSGNDTYASYSYSETAGVDGTGALSCSTNQNSNSIYDLLVTPVVKGTVTIDAKATASYWTPQLSFYKITDNGDGTYTRGDQITVDVSAINSSDYTTITIPVDEAGERIGIRSSYVWLDNFTATEATIVPEAKLTIASAEPSATTGTIKWEQQANGKVLVSYTVTVTNTGEVDLTQGDDGFSVSIINGSTGDVYATVAVPQDLAVGETSDEFVVSAEVETSLWPNSYTYISMNLKENIYGSVVTRAQSTYVAYEPKLVFRAAESTSTSSITTAQAWGTITESKTESFEIANTGTAPLTIKSITLPDGFTSDNAPTAEFTLAKGETQALNITQDATAQGTFAGNLAIVYLDKDAAEQTYTLAFSATVIGENTWTADFNGSTSSGVTYPAGAVAEAGISTDYQYISSGNYNIWLTGRNTSGYDTANNKFITPKLHANAGDQLAFDVKAGYNSSDAYFVKVYVSTDRVNWGEPVETYVYSTVGSSFTTKTISFDTTGDYYVAFALYGTGSGIDNLVGLEKVDVAHDLYIKEVTWPDASIKTGTSQSSKPKVTVIPLTTEAADAYTVKYISGETVLATVDSKALTASASSTTEFAFTWTPNVESTTVYPATKVVFEFTDGTKFETETFDLTVTNEPIFHFVKDMPSSKWTEPSDVSTPIAFGKTNTADAQSFYVYNWGSAPLTVKSIAVPAGFTVTPAEQFAVAAFDENDMSVAAQAVEITFSATEAGTYSGNLVITYVNGAGEDATFELALSGTMLDPTKFYANFGGESNQWPAGSVYQSNVSTTYVATGDYAITSSSATNNLFVTPKLTAAAGDKLLFDAKLYSTSWSEGKVVVYAAATRDEVLNAEEGTTRQQLFSVSGQDAENTMTTDFQTFEVTVPSGEWYLGFEISGRPYVDEIYGLAVANVEHDWTIASSNIPTKAMQNVAATATVNVQNLGLTEEAADSYTATLYVNDEAAATAEAVALPMIHKLSDAGTQLSFSFLTSKVGTFPVYVELKAGDYSVTTEPVDVTFAEEVFVNDAIEIGSGTTTSYTYAPIDFYNFEQAKTSDIVYTAEQLTKYGLKNGDKISTLAFKGTLSSAKTMSNSSLRAWVGLKTGDITYGSPDKSAMTEVTVYNAGDMVFVAGTNMVTINLPENITYDGTSDLRIYLEGGGNSEYVSLYFAYDTNYSNMKWSNATSMKYNPLLYVTLDTAPATLAGNVKTSANEAIEGATITLKADNGVEYSGTTAADGSYSFNVIQAGLDFTATVEAEGFLKKEFALNLGGASATQDVTLYKRYGIVGGFPGFDWNNDKVMTQSTDDPNIFTLVVEDVELDATKYEYKLRADGIWKAEDNDGYQLPDEGNNDWTFNLAGKYTLKFTANVSEHTLTLEPSFKLEDNTTNIAAANLGGVTITSGRQFKEGWNAIYLPVYVSAEEVTAIFGENAEIAYYAGDETDASGNVTVKFGKRTEGSIEAGVPYLLWSEKAVDGLELTGREIVADQWPINGTTFDFVGVYTETTNNAGDYIVQGGEFRQADASNSVLPFRAYLKLKEGTTPARSLNFVVVEDGGSTTGIDAAEISGLETVEGIYNLNGQKVETLKRGGLYIINGKKVVFRK